MSVQDAVSHPVSGLISNFWVFLLATFVGLESSGASRRSSTRR